MPDASPLPAPSSPPANVLCLDIGGHKYAAALCRADGTLIVDRFVRTQLKAGAGAITAGLLDLAEAFRRERPADFAAVRACGIGFGGPVADNRPRRSLHVAGWGAVDLCAVVADRFGIPAVMGNDGDVAALGEHRLGAGRGTRDMIYLTVSTGIGGGVILDGKLRRGAHGACGEIGHIRIAREGPPCPCGGTGCLESLCSGTAMGRMARELAGSRPERCRAMLAAVGGDVSRIDAAVLFAAAAAGDEGPAELLAGRLDDLARGLVGVANALDPEVIVLGGGVSRAGAALLDPLRRRMREWAMPGIAEGVRIEAAELGEMSVLQGAAVLAAG